MSSRRFLLRRVWHLAIPTPPAMGYSPTEYAEFTEPPSEMSSHGFFLRRVWHLAIPTPPSMGYSPTEYAEFTEPPSEMSSHGFLLRRVCHLAIPTPPAMGYSILPQNTPNSQNLLLRCPPTDFTDLHRYLGCAVLPQNSQNSQNLSACVLQGCHTLLHLCASVLICGSLFSARRFRVFRGNLFPPSEFTEFTEFVSVCIAGMPYPPTSVRIRAHLWESFLCQKFL